jgi:hypothetical protein
MNDITIADDGKSITVTLPITFVQRSSRKRIVLPDNVSAWGPPRPKVNSVLVKALSRAWRWKRLAESGKYGTLSELAKAEGVNFSYLCRVLRLSLLSPIILDAILDGKYADKLDLKTLLQHPTQTWEEQEK